MRLPSRDFSDIGKLLSGNAIPQILFLLTLPILAGLFNKEAFGVFAAFSALIAFAQPLSMLTLENALLTSRPKALNDTFFVSIFMLIGFASILSLVIFCILNFKLIYSINFDPVYTLLIFFGVLIFGLARLSIILANRETANTSIAKASFFAGCIRVFFPLSTGIFFNGNPLLLILGSILGELAIFLILNNFFSTIFYKLSSFLKTNDTKKIYQLLKSNSNFLLQGSIATFMINSSAFIPAMGIGYLWGAEAVGIYFMADRIIGLPAQFMSGALNTYFVSSYSKNIREKINGTKFILRSLFIGIVLSLPFIIIVFFADQWLILLLGDEWSSVLEILNYVLLVAISKILIMPISTIPFILRKQNYELLGGVGRILFLLIAFLFIQLFNLNEVSSLQAICIAIASSYWIFFAIYIWLNNQYLKKLD